METGKNSEWEDKSERKSGRGKERKREREEDRVKVGERHQIVRMT